MSPTYKEAAFPAEYRAAQVRQIMAAVFKLRSIAVTGLAGMGKSNVVRFMVAHPQVRARYLRERANDYAFIHVDCTGLIESTEAEILGEIASQLQREGLAHDAEAPVDAVRHRLKELILAMDPRLNLVVIMDDFDEAATTLNKTFFNYLFHLRNARALGNLSYVFVTRRPMGRLYELQELLDDGCIVGPLGDTDALGLIRRDEARLGCTFDATQRARLIACTAGYPGFLKNADELLASGYVDARLSCEEVAGQLLHSDKIKSLGEELWNDLDTAEQQIVVNAARHRPLPSSADRSRVTYLQQSGLLVKPEAGQSSETLLCPPLKTFILKSKAAATGALRITPIPPNQVEIGTALSQERVTLSPKLFAVLLALAEAPGQVLSSDEIITRVYGAEAAGVTNAALAQLVKRLRSVLDPCVQKMTDDRTHTCVETVRNTGYRFTG